MQKSHVTTIYIAVASLLICASVLAVLTIQWSMSGSGSVKGVGIGVYWNPECTNPTTSIEFGELEPGASKNFNLYLRNEGTSALNMSMSATNWNPANAADVMTLTWNREGQEVNPDQVVDLVITLSVSSDIQDISNFSMDIIISGTAS